MFVVGHVEVPRLYLDMTLMMLSGIINQSVGSSQSQNWLAQNTLILIFIQKNPEAVVENCTEAIKLNNKYTKALSRRATAAEQLGNLTMALEGKTYPTHMIWMSPFRILGVFGVFCFILILFQIDIPVSKQWRP